MDFIREEAQDMKNVFSRFKRRDFSGTGGQVVKNSTYQLITNVVAKGGSLIFAAIIARILLPELFGLYTITLATIILFTSFANLGLGSALITFGAKMLGKGNEKKAKAYLKKLLQWKLLIVSITSIVLLGCAYFIAEFYYSKPIFYALLAGGLYLPVVTIMNFVEGIFKTNNDFKTPLKKEIILQISKLGIIPLVLLFFLKSGLTNQVIVFISIMTLTLTYSISLLFLILKAKTKINFLNAKTKNLTGKETNELKKFIYPLSATIMAGLFFGYIDTLMLGRFINQSEFIAYYGAAFGLVGAASMLIGFMASSMMPLFAKNSGKVLEKIFLKTRNLTAIISVAAGIFTYSFARGIIVIIYGIQYSPAVNVLKWFSLLIMLTPVVGLYVGYYTTQKKTKSLASLIIFSAILNIVLNYFGIPYGLKVGGPMGGVFAAVGATILSRVFYLAALAFFRRR